MRLTDSNSTKMKRSYLMKLTGCCSMRLKRSCSMKLTDSSSRTLKCWRLPMHSLRHWLTVFDLD